VEYQLILDTTIDAFDAAAADRYCRATVAALIGVRGCEVTGVSPGSVVVSTLLLMDTIQEAEVAGETIQADGFPSLLATAWADLGESGSVPISFLGSNVPLVFATPLQPPSPPVTATESTAYLIWFIVGIVALATAILIGLIALTLLWRLRYSRHARQHDARYDDEEAPRVQQQQPKPSVPPPQQQQPDPRGQQQQQPNPRGLSALSGRPSDGAAVTWYNLQQEAPAPPARHGVSIVSEGGPSPSHTPSANRAALYSTSTPSATHATDVHRELRARKAERAERERQWGDGTPAKSVSAQRGSSSSVPSPMPAGRSPTSPRRTFGSPPGSQALSRARAAFNVRRAAAMTGKVASPARANRFERAE